jgi:putative endonuclease
MTTQKEIGEKGEKLAARYLADLGYQIRERNWHFGHNEIDIIALDGDELVIVEVKARTSDQYEHPSEAVTKQKITHIVEAAEGYIQLHEIDLETRFDVITVIFYGQEYELEHFKDAFYPMR